MCIETYHECQYCLERRPGSREHCVLYDVYTNLNREWPFEFFHLSRRCPLLRLFPEQEFRGPILFGTCLNDTCPSMKMIIDPEKMLQDVKGRLAEAGPATQAMGDSRYHYDASHLDELTKKLKESVDQVGDGSFKTTVDEFILGIGELQSINYQLSVDCNLQRDNLAKSKQDSAALERKLDAMVKMTKTSWDEVEKLANHNPFKQRERNRLLDDLVDSARAQTRASQSLKRREDNEWEAEMELRPKKKATGSGSKKQKSSQQAKKGKGKHRDEDMAS